LLIVKSKLEQMSFNSMAEGRVDGADRCKQLLSNILVKTRIHEPQKYVSEDS